MVHWDQTFRPSKEPMPCLRPNAVPRGGAPKKILWFLLCALLGGAAGEGGAFPVLWYNLGGVIVNALTTLVFLPLTLIPNGRQSSKYHSTKPPGPTPPPERSPEPGSA